MMYSRLMVARTLLSEDGVIFISIDDNEVENLKKICNEIFGEFNFQGHPAFVCGDNAIGAQLRFGTDNDNVAYKLLSEDGLLMPEEHYLTLVNNNVTITKEFFDKDALIVENSGIKKVSLSKDCEPVVEVMFNAPVFGLWSAAGKGVPFVCIEPWYGRTDAIDSDGSLDAREWGNELAGGETFTGGYRCKFL